MSTLRKDREPTGNAEVDAAVNNLWEVLDQIKFDRAEEKLRQSTDPDAI